MQACNFQASLGQQHTKQSWQDQCVLVKVCDHSWHAAVPALWSNTTCCIRYALPTQRHVEHLLLRLMSVLLLFLIQ